MTPEQQNIAAKIRKMAQMTVSNGCSEQEAMVYAERIGELLEVHNLSLDKVFLDSVTCVQAAAKFNRQRRHPIEWCMVAIARYVDCKIWGEGANFTFFGLENDVRMGLYLTSIVYKSMEASLAVFQLSDVYQLSQSKKTMTISFQKGMAARIGQRLNEIKAERSKQATQKIEFAGTDMVLLKKNKVDEEYEAKYGTARTKKHYASASTVNHAAYFAGHNAANSVNLNRPLENSNTTKALTNGVRQSP